MSLQLCQLRHLCHLDVCRSMFCFDIQGGAAVSIINDKELVSSYYCEWINWRYKGLKSKLQLFNQFLNQGHVLVAGGNVGSNVQDLLRQFGSIDWIVSVKLSIESLCLRLWCRFLLLMAHFRLWSWPPGSFTRHVWHWWIDWNVSSDSCVPLSMMMNGVWSTAAGHCVSWAGASGEMAKVQGEPWFSQSIQKYTFEMRCWALSCILSANRGWMEGAKLMPMNAWSTQVFWFLPVILKFISWLMVASTDHLQNYSLSGKRKRCCTNSWGWGWLSCWMRNLSCVKRPTSRSCWTSSTMMTSRWGK